MADWTKSMQQTFEFYIVDPNTWMDKQRIDVVTANSITYDSSSGTLGSATLETTEELGENYIRTYLVTFQNGVKERFALGTFLYLPPSISCDGKNSTLSMNGYSPLIELKEKYMPIGFSAKRGEKIIERCANIISGKLRAPHTMNGSGIEPRKIVSDDYVSSFDTDILNYVTNLLTMANYKFGLDRFGNVTFVPEQNIDEMRPSWIYTEDNSSILLPDVSIDKDIFEIPNVVEVLYSNSDKYYYSRVVNDDPSSITSIQNRGREIHYRTNQPSVSGVQTQASIDDYATMLLKSLSTVECKISYEHGYCPVQVDDCVLINYGKLGLVNKKAKVISQEINCETGCSVSETAVFTEKLWEAKS